MSDHIKAMLEELLGAMRSGEIRHRKIYEKASDNSDWAAVDHELQLLSEITKWRQTAESLYSEVMSSDLFAIAKHSETVSAIDEESSADKQEEQFGKHEHTPATEPYSDNERAFWAAATPSYDDSYGTQGYQSYQDEQIGQSEYTTPAEPYGDNAVTESEFGPTAEATAELDTTTAATAPAAPSYDGGYGIQSHQNYWDEQIGQSEYTAPAEPYSDNATAEETAVPTAPSYDASYGAQGYQNYQTEQIAQNEYTAPAEPYGDNPVTESEFGPTAEETASLDTTTAATAPTAPTEPTYYGSHGAQGYQSYQGDQAGQSEYTAPIAQNEYTAPAEPYSDSATAEETAALDTTTADTAPAAPTAHTYYGSHGAQGYQSYQGDQAGQSEYTAPATQKEYTAPAEPYSDSATAEETAVPTAPSYDPSYGAQGYQNYQAEQIAQHEYTAPAEPYVNNSEYSATPEPYPKLYSYNAADEGEFGPTAEATAALDTTTAATAPAAAAASATTAPSYDDYQNMDWIRDLAEILSRTSENTGAGDSSMALETSPDDQSYDGRAAEQQTDRGEAAIDIQMHPNPTNPERMRFLGKEYAVSGWDDMFIKVCEILLLHSPYKLAAMDTDGDLNKDGRKNYSYLESELKQGKQLSNGLWVETQDDSEVIHDRCLRLLEKCGLAPHELRIDRTEHQK